MWIEHCTDLPYVLLSCVITLYVLRSGTAAPDGCRTGYYGPRCERRCKEQSHCLYNHCVLLPSGRALNCSIGCRPGWRGLSCNTNCKHPCKECARNSGECVGACRDGYYGDGCTRRCPEGCESCEKTSGSCLRCNDGLYGQYCNKTCPERCKSCEKLSGNCLQAADYEVLDSEMVKVDVLVVEERFKPEGERRVIDSTDNLPAPTPSPAALATARSATAPRTKTSAPGMDLYDGFNPERDRFVQKVVIGVLGCITVIFVFTAFMLMFYKRRGHTENWVKGEESGSEAPFLDTEPHLVDEKGDNSQFLNTQLIPRVLYRQLHAEKRCMPSTSRDTSFENRNSLTPHMHAHVGEVHVHPDGEHLYDEIEPQTVRQGGNGRFNQYLTPVHPSFNNI